MKVEMNQKKCYHQVVRSERRIIRHGSLDHFKQLDEVMLQDYQYPMEMLIESVGLEMGVYLQKLIRRRKLDKNAKIVFLCGSGHNGADGLVCARTLLRRGYVRVNVLFLDERERLGDMSLKKLGLLEMLMKPVDSVVFSSDFQQVFSILSDCDVIVDALYGVGYKRSLSPFKRQVVQESVNIFYDQKLIVALDIPTGLSDEKKQDTVTAHHTLSVCGHKDLFFLSENEPYTGKIQTIAGDFPPQLLEERLSSLYVGRSEKSDKKTWENKYTRGVSLIIGSSLDYEGAVYMNIGGALKGGASYLKALSPTILKVENYPQVVVLNKSPRVCLDRELYDQYKEEITSGRIKNILMGSGLGRRPSTAAVFEELLRLQGKNIILDADGLYFIRTVLRNSQYEWWTQNNEVLFTPHLGEFLSLMEMDKGRLHGDFFAALEKFSELYKVHLLLKDSGNLFLCDQKDKKNRFFFRNPSRYLSKAGSGDILAGLILGNLSYHRGLLRATEEAVLQFMALGRKVERKWGENSPITYLYERN